MTVYVVDASVVAKWFLDEEYSEAARNLLRPGIQLHAPDFVHAEIASLVCKHVRRGDFAAERGRAILTAMREVALVCHPFDRILPSAVDISFDTGQHVYDCLYLALAVLLDGNMITSDQRLYQGISESPVAEYAVLLRDGL